MPKIPWEFSSLPAFPSQPSYDGFLEWCANHMARCSNPRSARDLGVLWVDHWRGKKEADGRPSSSWKKHLGKLTDRAAKWLARQVAAGRIAPIDQTGKWSAKRYVKVDGQRLTYNRRKNV